MNDDRSPELQADARAGLSLAALRAEVSRSLASRNPRRAEQLAAIWLQRQPGDPDALRLLALAALDQGRGGEARMRLAEALARAPGRADLHALSARVLSLLGDTAAALAAVDAALADADETALAQSALDADTLDTLGVVLSRAHRHQRACTLFEAAAARAPGRAGIQYNRAASLKFIGHFDAAEAAYEACIACDPGYWRAHSGLAQLRTATPARNHLPRLQALAAGLAHQDLPQASIHIHQALAKEHEDLGDAALTLTHWQRAKQARRRLQPYRPEADRRCFDSVEHLFSAPRPAVIGSDNSEALFVIGMPRTGTTLVDRILSSHPDVHSAGELPNFALLLKQATGTPGPLALDPATLERGLSVDARALGEAYVASTRPDTGHSRYFVDKMPLNVWYAGYIHRALPKARLICLLRHPLDTVLSNFRTLFTVDNPLYGYADDLVDCARYVVGFRRLVRLWQQQLGAAFLVIDYETLVAAPEPTIGQLLAHCGLSPDPRCLAFERNPAPVATASSVQVRRPLNRDSIGRWRRHAEALAPARRVLEEAGIDCN